MFSEFLTMVLLYTDDEISVNTRSRDFRVCVRACVSKHSGKCGAPTMRSPAAANK